MQNNKYMVVVVSDTHAGHKYGLCNPATTLYDFMPNGEVRTSYPVLCGTQEYLWALQERIIDTVSKFDIPVALIHLGDHTNGMKYPDGLMRSDPYNQYEIAFHNMVVWAKLPNIQLIRLVFGTGSHEFGEGSAVLTLAQRLKDNFPGLDICATRHGDLTLGGAKIDYAHHGPSPGIRNWTHGNVARHYTRSMMYDEIVAGNRPPDLVLRGHFHTPCNEVVTVGPHETRIVVMPSMCGLSDFAQQVTRSVYRITNGVCYFKIEDGEISKPKWDKETIDIRLSEVIE